jgi:hypothetical protein
MTKKYYRDVLTVNKAQCHSCGDIIESKHVHDFRSCSCGSLSVDGGLDYARRCFTDREGWTDLCESYQVEREPYSWELENEG